MKWIAGAAVAALALLSPIAAKGCDVALLLSMDRSASMNEEEYALQISGTANALRDERVQKAILNGFIGYSYVAVMTWGTGTDLVLNWTKLENAAGINAVADKIETIGRPVVPPVIMDDQIYPGGGESTHTTKSLKFAHTIMQSVPETCSRRVIDLSTDGVDNGPDREELPVVRRLLDQDRITVNVIAIEDVSPEPSSVMSWGSSDEKVYEWAEQNVITGPGAFTVRANFEAYEEALKAKLVIEVSAIDNILPKRFGLRMGTPETGMSRVTMIGNTDFTLHRKSTNRTLYLSVSFPVF